MDGRSSVSSLSAFREISSNIMVVYSQVLYSLSWCSELPKYILDYSATFCLVFNAHMIHRGLNDCPPPPLDTYSRHSFYARQDSTFKLSTHCSRPPNYVQTKSCKVGLPLYSCSRLKLTSKHSAIDEHEMQVGATDTHASTQCLDIP